MLTPGIADLSDTMRAAVLHRIATFNEFDDGNNPRHEHDAPVPRERISKFCYKNRRQYPKPTSSVVGQRRSQQPPKSRSKVELVMSTVH